MSRSANTVSCAANTVLTVLVSFFDILPFVMKKLYTLSSNKGMPYHE